MSSGSERPRESVAIPAAFRSRLHWLRGAVAGAVAAAVMAAAIGLGDLSVLRDAIAGLYLQAGNLVAGVLVHVLHGALFGVVFAVVLSDPTLSRVSNSLAKTVVAGVVYGLVLAVVGAGVVMPMWLDAVGNEAGLSIPNLSVPLLLWHLVFGVVLGAAYAGLAAEESA
ncbi:histidine kinase [Halomicrobium salinisoli]|uniref:histidine kinase n=1 Tax=Halomicrobium salinisoli TaxID=2878391 RepID=UPI001CF08617|nr:histidine kinase [Halomicrobium salinisoli]